MICTKDIGTATGLTTASNSINLYHYVGYDSTMSVLIAATVSNTLSTVAITQQCSVDQMNWYSPVSVYNVTADAVMVVAANSTSHSRFITFTPVLAPFIRLNVTLNNTTDSVAMSLVYQEE